jgi:uncharacterized LabA/DUF88 family protein
MKKISLFIDDATFYHGWKETGHGLRIIFHELNAWLQREMGAASIVGAHYYAAIDPPATDAPDAVIRRHAFLEMLEQQTGYFVHKYSRTSNRSLCVKCGMENRIPHQHDLDVAMTVDALRAAHNDVDGMVFISNTAALQPLLDALQTMGKIAVVSSWQPEDIPHRLRKSAYATLDLSLGMDSFCVANERTEPSRTEPPRASPSLTPRAAQQTHTHAQATTSPPMLAAESFLSELRLAEERFAGGYVGVGYFLGRWRSQILDGNAEVRRKLMDELVASQQVEIYSASDGAQAIRITQASPAVVTSAAPPTIV